MKNISLLFIALLLLQFNSLAQEGWFLQHPYPTTSDLSAVDFIDELVGTSVGNNGAIASTTDGGNTWTLQTSGTTIDLNDVCLTNSDICTAVGNEGTILRTTDGGETWESQTSTTVNDIYGVSFFDELTGMVVGAEGTILTTSDGGTTWIEQTSGTTYKLNDVCFINDSTAITVGGGGMFEGIILRTTDIGITWIEPTNSINGHWYAVCFIDSLTGTAMNYYGGGLIRTTDGGVNWEQLGGLPESVSYKCYDISFSDANNGYMVRDYGYPFGSGSIWKTTDGGFTWNRQWFEWRGPFTYAVCATNFYNVIVVGDYGLILRTTDGGNTWNNQSSVTRSGMRHVCFANKYYGLVLPHPNLWGGTTSHLRTTDGGNNWLCTTVELIHYGISLADSKNGIAVGSNIISKTTDGGITWEHQDFPSQHFFGVSYIDANHATAVGHGGIIFHTTDGGENWIEQQSNTTQDLTDVCFTDSNHGVAVGDGGTILLTNDGGNTWSQRPSGTSELLRAVSFGDSQHGWIVVNGIGNVLKTNDGGFSWVQQTIGTTVLYDVSFSDPDNGTVVGEEGTILRTTDGGITWIQQTSGTTDGLGSVWFTDPDNGTVVGGTGLILRTTNGGVIPVELISFTASTSRGKVTLNWQTVTESNNQGFEIQRKIDNADWIVRGFSEGAGTTTEPQSYSFIDELNGITATSISYRLKQIDFNGSFEYSDEVLIDNPAPIDFSIQQNYPNPFNASTTIWYSLPNSGIVTLEVYNPIGEQIATLINEEKPAGTYEINWYAESLPSGIYFYRIKAGSFIETKKMVLLK